jgi:LysM repeat protein
MSDRESAQNVIDAYRKRQQKARKAPIFIIAVVMGLLGLAILVFWWLGSDSPSISLFATETPTPTNTATVTATATATATPTITPTPTLEPSATLVPTQSGPFVYQVEEGDTVWVIAQKFSVDMLVMITVNNLDPANPNIRVGDKLIIPGKDTTLPTPTPLPTGIRKGTIIEYQVQLGDSLLSIALKFNSTTDEIKKENEIENENQLYAGQTLRVPVNLVTAVPTSTITPTRSLTLNGTTVPTAVTPVGPAVTAAAPTAAQTAAPTATP